MDYPSRLLLCLVGITVSGFYVVVFGRGILEDVYYNGLGSFVDLSGNLTWGTTGYLLILIVSCVALSAIAYKTYSVIQVHRKQVRP